MESPGNFRLYGGLASVQMRLTVFDLGIQRSQRCFDCVEINYCNVLINGGTLLYFSLATIYPSFVYLI